MKPWISWINISDSAYAAGLPFARIVHGKGTGTLRQLVRQALSASPLVHTLGECDG